MSRDTEEIVKFSDFQRVRPAGRLPPREEPCALLIASWTSDNMLRHVSDSVEIAFVMLKLSGLDHDQAEEQMQHAVDLGIIQAARTGHE